MQIDHAHSSTCDGYTMQFVTAIMIVLTVCKTASLDVEEHRVMS